MEDLESLEDERDQQEECVLSKEEGLTLLQQAITQYYISQHLSQLSPTTTFDSSGIFFTSFLSLVEQSIDCNFQGSDLAVVLRQWKFKKVSVPEDGNCLFTAVAHNILERIKFEDEAVMRALQRLGVLSTVNKSPLDVSSLAKILCLLVVQEWQGEHADYYQLFVTTDIRSQASQYLQSGEFSGDLGDLMVVTLSNLLHIPITIFSNIPNLNIICITPVSNVDSIVPLYLTYISDGPGHYDYSVTLQSTWETLPSKKSTTRCFCGSKKNAEENHVLMTSLEIVGVHV